jgi:hypothetical protein
MIKKNSSSQLKKARIESKENIREIIKTKGDHRYLHMLIGL